MVSMIEVKSRNLDAIGYDLRRHSLYIRFIGNKLYRYKKVPALVWIGLQLASSKGSFFQEWIVGNFDYERVDEQTSTPRRRNLVTG